MTVGERIKLIRNNADLSMEKFGNRIGIARSSLSLIEKGTNNPSERTLKLICNEFRVNYEWLTEEKGEMYDNIGETILDKLAEEYRLNDLDKTVLETYLALTPEEKEGIYGFVNNVIKINKKRDKI